MTRNLLGIRHLDKNQIEDLLSLSADFKLRVIEGKPVPKMDKLVIGMLFFSFLPAMVLG